jgi:hypothetical protein
VTGAAAEGPFPDLRLRGLDGHEHALGEAWRDGAALVLVGHSECGTTLLSLPFADRIHRRRAASTTVVVVLQDRPEDAGPLAAGLGLEVPVRLDADPYPLSAAVGLGVVPTLFLIERGGRIASASEGFRRSDLERFAERLGVNGPLFTPEDKAPALRPG